jgi:hypothetical protein
MPWMQSLPPMPYGLSLFWTKQIDSGPIRTAGLPGRIRCPLACCEGPPTYPCPNTKIQIDKSEITASLAQDAAANSRGLPLL